jgi:hypothetical protein
VVFNTNSETIIVLLNCYPQLVSHNTRHVKLHLACDEIRMEPDESLAVLDVGFLKFGMLPQKVTKKSRVENISKIRLMWSVTSSTASHRVTNPASISVVISCGFRAIPIGETRFSRLLTLPSTYLRYSYGRATYSSNSSAVSDSSFGSYSRM